MLGVGHDTLIVNMGVVHVMILIGAVAALHVVSTAGATATLSTWVGLEPLLVVDNIGVTSLGFWDGPEGDGSTENVAGEEDPQGVWKTNLVRGEVVEEDGSQNGTALPNGGGKTVSQTTDTRWEDLGWDDEGGGVGSEVVEELSKSEADKLAGSWHMCEVSSEDGKEESSNEETTNLDWLTSENLDESDSEEVSWNITGDGDDEVSDGVLHQLLVLVLSGGETNGGQDDRLVKIDTIEGNIDQEPGGSGTEESLEMSPLAKVDEEGVELGVVDLRSGNDGWRSDTWCDTGSAILAHLTVLRSADVVILLSDWLIDLGGGRSSGVEFLRLQELLTLWHVETWPESGQGRDEGDTHLDTPDGIELTVVAVDVQSLLETSQDDDSDDGTGESTPSLVGEDEAEQDTTAAQVSSLRSDGSGHWIISSDTDTHEQTPAENPDHLLVWRWDAVGQADDHDHTDDTDDEFLSVDESTTEGVSQETERDLTDDVTHVGSAIDATTEEERIGFGISAPVLVDPDWSDQVDDEQIVRVQEETNASNQQQLDFTLGEERESSLHWLGSAIILEGHRIAIFIHVVTGVSSVVPLHVGLCGWGESLRSGFVGRSLSGQPTRQRIQMRRR